MSEFRTELGAAVFAQKYANFEGQTWEQKAIELCKVTGNHILAADHTKLYNSINDMKFMPGGRYIYYAGREAKFYNNCFLFLSKEDNREAWAQLVYDTVSATMCGGGIGNDYSVFRPRGSLLGRTGGEASGPVPLMMMVNDNGRYVMQGGSRRTANYASLNWRHGDINEFMHAKDWENQLIQGAFDKDGNPMTVKAAKEADFNYKAPLDMTNISINYDNNFLTELYDVSIETLQSVYDKGGKAALQALPIVKIPDVFYENVRQACKNGEPGFGFNFFEQLWETARNACTEVVSADDGDVCNIGSVNMANIDTIEEFREVVRIGTTFLACGLIEGELPNEKIEAVRKKNNRIGLGLMGVHEWLLKRGYKYGMRDELREWLQVYKDESDKQAESFCAYLGIAKPVAVRAIAPTGSIGILAGTTTGIEPLYAAAYKRRYLKNADEWHFQYCLDATAKTIVDNGVKPEDIETATNLAKEPRRRIEFQADVQDYVDMAISSTLNLPEWGSVDNNEDTVKVLAEILAEFAPRLRGITFYPDGSRGGQPIEEVPWGQAVFYGAAEFLEENDPCKGGSCGA